MNPEIFIVLQSAVLVAALSVDAFVASFAYGTNKIKIPFSSAMVISLICSFILAVSLLLGSLLRPFIPDNMTKILCFTLLMLLGITKLCDSIIKSYIRKNEQLHKKLSFSVFSLSFILTIYADPEEADRDSSKILSPVEATSLAIALSLDGLAVGFSAAIADVNSVQILVFSLIVNLLSVLLGSLIGRKISEKTTLNLSWLGAVLLMVLAFLKL